MQRFDRMYVLMTETFCVVFAISFGFGVIVVLFSSKIVSLVTVGNSFDDSLIPLSCLRGMFKAFRMAQSVALADNNSKRYWWL